MANIHEVEVNPWKCDARKISYDELGIEANPIEGYQELRVPEVPVKQVGVGPSCHGFRATAEGLSDDGDVVETWTQPRGLDIKKRASLWAAKALLRIPGNPC